MRQGERDLAIRIPITVSKKIVEPSSHDDEVRIRDGAAIIGRTTATIYRWRKEGKIALFYRGGRAYARLSDLVRIVNKKPSRNATRPPVREESVELVFMDMDTFADEESRSALDGILYEEAAATLTETLVSLEKHQRKMLRLRFGIYDPSNRGKGFWTRDSNDRLVELEFTGRPLRLGEVGAIYLLSKERARQMIEEAMSLVRRRLSTLAVKKSVRGLSYLDSNDQWWMFYSRYMELHLGNTLYDHEELFQEAYAGIVEEW